MDNQHEETLDQNLIIAGPVEFVPRVSLNYQDAARALGVSPSTIKRLVGRGELIPCRDGQQIALIQVDELRRYLARKREKSLKK